MNNNYITWSTFCLGVQKNIYKIAIHQTSNYRFSRKQITYTQIFIYMYGFYFYDEYPLTCISDHTCMVAPTIVEIHVYNKVLQNRGFLQSCYGFTHNSETYWCLKYNTFCSFTQRTKNVANTSVYYQFHITPSACCETPYARIN